MLELGSNPGEVDRQSVSVTTALHCWKEIFTAMTGDDSVRAEEKIHDLMIAVQEL